MFFEELPTDMVTEIIAKTIDISDYNGAINQLAKIRQICKKFNEAANSNLIRKKFDQALLNDFCMININPRKAIYLIILGASVDIQDKNGTTALILAAAYNQVDLTKLLIQKNANLNVATKLDKYTALQLAIERKSNESAILLINAGADLNIINSEGKTALDIAESFRNKTIMEILKEKNAKRGIELP